MDATNNNHPSKKKKKNQTPDSQFRFDLYRCSKNKDLASAISLYESATTAAANSVRLNLHHFNSLLYLCSNAVADPSTNASAIEFGFRLFDQMMASGVEPNEATLTALARLAAAKEDGDFAFDLVRKMVKLRASPKLRSYGPALFCFCRNGEADKAYEVEEHLASTGLHPEEAELAALLKVSVEKGREEKVYEYVHKIRGTISCVSESTAEIIESWFGGAMASNVGVESWDVAKVKEAISRNGGGWHGLGWLGKGKWIVHRTNIDSGGCCCSCQEQLVCVDINTEETEKFSHSVAALAMEREVHSNFKEFRDWLNGHSDYEAIVDGANVGLYQQNFDDGGFSISQLDSVVKELHYRSKKLPLVILHKKRVRPLFENASSRALLQEWMDQGVLYGTPYGSNDDWYWLYAAVKLKCLLVTNDEMRDHIFALLGSSFFLKWKERHQVRYTFVKGSLKLQMPPSYSLIIQESENGSWHVPLVGEICDESSRTWLCITRLNSCKAYDEFEIESSGVGQGNCRNMLQNCKTNDVATENDINVSSGSHLTLDCKPMAMSGKRKARSPSPR